MMKKLLIFLLAVLLMPAIVKAQNPILVLHHANGNTSEVELYTMPRILMTADKMQIKSSVAELEYDKTDVLRFTFKNVGTGIDAVHSEMAFRIDEDCVTFRGIPEAGAVKVYNLKGVQIPVRLEIAGGDAVLSLSQLPKGIYLVDINSKTLKIIRP